MPSPPNANVFRVRMTGTDSDAGLWGTRFFLSYNLGPPNAADCTTLATNAINEWKSELAQYITTGKTLTLATVTDLSSPTGASSEVSASVAGTLTGGELPAAVSGNLAFAINRRYRGGHPKSFLPVGSEGTMQTAATWTSALITGVNAAWGGFIAALIATSGLSVSGLQHVNVSFYSGYTPVGPFPDGKLKYPPKPRAVAVIDPVVTHALNPLMSSQKRRRTATTP